MRAKVEGMKDLTKAEKAAISHECTTFDGDVSIWDTSNVTSFEEFKPALSPEELGEILKLEKRLKKDKVANWLDANVWDGDELSKVEDSGNHITRLTPMDLYELVTDCFEALKEIGNE